MPIPRRPSIAIVDDDPVDARLTRHLLGDDYIVRVYDRAVDALSEFVSATPDVVLCDIMMPNWNGPHLLHAIRNTPECFPVPVIALTGLRTPGIEARLLELGFAEVLFKPVEPDVLLAAVRRALGLTTV